MYDISKFAKLHPGGRGVILRYAGQDATEAFHQLHADHVLRKCTCFVHPWLLGVYESHLWLTYSSFHANPVDPTQLSGSQQFFQSLATNQLPAASFPTIMCSRLIFNPTLRRPTPLDERLVIGQLEGYKSKRRVSRTAERCCPRWLVYTNLADVV